MKIATTIGDFDGYVKNDAEAVRAFEGTGFRHLDFSFYNSNYDGSPFMTDNWVKEIAAASKEAEKLGFDFVQAHSPKNDIFLDDPDTVIKGNIRAIEACGYLGINKLVVHSGRNPNLKKSKENAVKNNEEIRRFFESLYPAMEKYNVYVLAENYTPSDDICGYYSGEDLCALMECCNHPLMGVCWDIGHANLSEPADQYENIMKLGDYLKAVHIQDNFGVHDDHICPLTGTVDIDAVMRGLKDVGFIENGGTFTFEANNLVTRSGSWPNKRNESGECLAANPCIEVKKQAERLLFEIGKHILTKYDCFED